MTETETTEASDDQSAEQAVMESVEILKRAVLDRDAEGVCSVTSSDMVVQAVALTGEQGCEAAIGQLMEKVPDQKVRETEEQLEEAISPTASGW